MKSYNLLFDIRGPGGTQKGVPNCENPIDVEDLPEALHHIAKNLPGIGDGPFNLTITGIHLTEVEKDGKAKGDDDALVQQDSEEL